MENLFLIVRCDGPDSSDKRLEAMQAHLKYSTDNEHRFMVGGALRIQSDQAAVGSAMVIKAHDMDDARTFADADPFAAIGVYETTEIYIFNTGIGTWIGERAW